MALDMSTAILPGSTGGLDLSTAIYPPEPPWKDVLSAVGPTTMGGLQRFVGGGMEMAGDIVEGLTGYGGVARTGRGIGESGQITQELSTPKNMSLAQESVLSGLSSVGQMIPAAMAYPIMGPLGVVAGMGIQTAGQTYQESRAANLPPLRSLLHAGFEGAVESGTEYLPAKILFGASKNLLTRLVNYFMREVPGELVATALQDASAKLGYKPDMTVDEFIHDMMVTIGSTLVAGPVQTGLAHVAMKVAPGAFAGEEPAAVPPATSPASGGIPPANPPGVVPPVTPPPPAGAAPGTVPPGILPPLPGSPPTQPPMQPPVGEPSVADLFARLTTAPAAGGTMEPGPTLEQMKAQVEANPPTKEQVDLVNGLDEQLKNIRTTTEEKAAEAPTEQMGPPRPPELMGPPRPDITNTEYVATHLAQRTAEGEPPNPANSTNPAEHPVLFGPPELVGKPIGDTVLAPGTVVTMGYPSDRYPAPYLKVVHDTMQDWVRRFAPNAKVVITTRDKFNDSVVAQTTFNGGYAFVIPRPYLGTTLEMMQPTEQYPEGIHEPGAQLPAIFSLAHEFGRILEESTFREADPATKAAITNAWKIMRAQVESGKMTAREFMEKWANPWKATEGMRTENRDKFIQRVMFGPKSERSVEKVTAMQLVQKLVEPVGGNVEQVLSLQSWMAEQAPRYFYAKGDIEKTAIGRFFAKVLQRLRDYFDSFKQQYGATVPFTKWLDSMVEATTIVPTAVKKAAAKKPRKPRTKAVPPTATTLETPTEPVTVVDVTARTKQLRGQALKIKKDMPEEYVRVMEMIKAGQFDEAQETLSSYFDESGEPKFELGEIAEADANRKGVDAILVSGLTRDEALNSSNKAYAERLAKAMGGVEYTPMFKSWGGDWEAHQVWTEINAIDAEMAKLPADAEKERATFASARLEAQNRGRQLQAKYKRARSENPPPKPFVRLFDAMDRGIETMLATGVRPTVTAVVDATGRPMSVYHGTGVDFTIFRPGRLNPALWFAGKAHTAEAFSKTYIDMTVPPENQAAHSAVNAKIAALQETLSRVPRNQGQRRQAIQRGIDQYIQEMSDLQVMGLGPPTIYRVYLRMMNPLEMDAQNAFSMPHVEMYDQAQNAGHDGIIVYNAVKGGVGPESGAGGVDNYYIVFEPEQVKSSVSNVLFSDTAEMHFELGNETESAINNDMQRIPKDADIDTVDLGEGMRNLSRWQLAVLQLQQLAHLNQGVPGLQYFNAINGIYEHLRKTLMARGQEVAKNWQFLMKESRALLDKALTAEYEEERHWATLRFNQAEQKYEFVPSEVMLAKMRQIGVNPDTAQGKMVIQTYLDTKQVHMDQLGQLEVVLFDRLKARYGRSPMALHVKAAQMFETVRGIREVPFLPQTRFGKYAVVVSEVRGNRATPVHVEYFEDRKQRDKAFLKLRKSELNKGNRRVSDLNMTDNVGVMPSIPQSYIDTVVELLGLSEEDALQMQLQAQAVKAKSIFGKYDKEFRKITGASKDLQRNFSDHVWHNANMIAKLKFRPEFTKAITAVGTQIRSMRANSMPTAPLQNLQEWMRIQRDYILNPQSEWQKVRSIVSMLALWGNVKTASMNATSIVNTWSVLISKYGYKRASEAIMKAMKDEASVWTGTVKFTPAEKALREKLNVEGVTDQSYAYNLAELSNSSAMRRAFKQTRAGRAWEQLLLMGMLPFRVVEIYSRRAGALAAARLELEDQRKKGVDEQTAINIAHKYASDTVLLTQNDFSPGNRPRFAQGKQSIALIFFSFVQMMMFNMGGGVGAAAAARLWVFYAMLGGLLGLPGMENLFDIMKLVWRKVLGQTEDPKLELYEFLQEVTGGNARLLMNGMFQDIGGFDLSRSISLGRIIPGTDVLAGEGDLAFKTENLAADLTGPLGGTVHGLLQFLTSDDPNFLKRTAFAMPGAMRNLLQAYMYANEGVRGPSGAVISRDRDGTLRELNGLELFGKALGFQPTIVSQNREVDREQREMRDFWMHKRSGLLRHMWNAELQGDREAVADTRELIRKFNESAPDKSLHISQADIKKSHDTRMQLLRRDENNRAPIKRFDPLYRELESTLLGSPP